MAKIKAVLFDLDNTLIDFWGAKNASIDAALEAMAKAGLGMPKPRARRIIFDLYERHGIEHLHIFQKFLLKTRGRVDMRLLSAGIVAYRNVSATYHKPYAGAERTIRALRRRGLRLGVVSDAPTLKAWLRLTEIGLADCFDAIVGYDDTKKRKPSKAPFLFALKKMKLSPGEVLYVGDNPARDIRGAKLLGMRTALAEYGMQPWQRKHLPGNTPDHVLRRPGDLLKVVR